MDFGKLYEIIYKIYDECDIVAFPIDCFDIIRRYRYHIVKYSELTPKKRDACRQLSEDACLIKDTLYYDENAHPRRIQFSIAHELGHKFLGTESEDNADCFASHFFSTPYFDSPI